MLALSFSVPEAMHKKDTWRLLCNPLVIETLKMLIFNQFSPLEYCVTWPIICGGRTGLAIHPYTFKHKAEIKLRVSYE
jgi:hypothetical protein